MNACHPWADDRVFYRHATTPIKSKNDGNYFKISQYLFWYSPSCIVSHLAAYWPSYCIDIDEGQFGTSSFECASEISCTTTHKGKTYSVSVQNGDLVIQAQDSTHSIKVKGYESGDFGIDLSQRRYAIPDLRVDAMISLANGNTTYSSAA